MLISVVDILLVAYLVYRLLILVRSTRAWRIFGGIVIFLAALFLSDYFGLRTLHWVLDKLASLAPVALAILLLPEMRQALEGFAKIGLWPERLPGSVTRSDARTVEELVAACAEMGANRTGALIVVERGVKLDDVVANGVEIKAKVSVPLLTAIFYEGNPLHDGAAILRGDTIAAAACQLPLSQDSRVASHLHMRHRAGLGIAEVSDCLAIIVSEERGTISVAFDGALVRLNDHSQLRDLLNRELRGVQGDVRRSRRRDRTRVGAGK